MATILLSCAYAAWFGQRAGKYAAGIILFSAAITIGAGGRHGWQTTSFMVMSIDLLIFLVLGTIATYFHSRWLVCIAGLQLAKLATHLATLVSPSFPSALYQALIEAWVILIVAVMASGLWLERRKPQ